LNFRNETDWASPDTGAKIVGKKSKTRFVLILLLLSATFSMAGQRKKKSGPCANPQSQAEMTQCAGKAYKEADAVLNQVYQKFVAILDNEEKAELRTAQEAWLKYRDSNCEFVAGQFKGGTMRPMVYAFCLEDVTKKRTTELRGQIRDRSQ
jgi:uncharacterized protein YecT (DUF1311 family)